MKNKRKNVVRRFTALMLACGILFTAPWAVAQDSGVATCGFFVNGDVVSY